MQFSIAVVALLIQLPVSIFAAPMMSRGITYPKFNGDPVRIGDPAVFEAEAIAAHEAAAAAGLEAPVGVARPKPVEPMPTEEEVPTHEVDFEEAALAEPVKPAEVAPVSVADLGIGSPPRGLLGEPNIPGGYTQI